MANRIEFAVSATPIATGTISEGVEADTIAGDIRKTLGGSASIATAHTTVGYDAGDVEYADADDSGGSALTLGSGGYDFVFIKHTGHLYSSTTVLGDAVTDGTDLEVTIGSQKICTLPPGGAIVLPTVPAAAVKVQSDHASEHIAVEYILST
jgi:hypothetical protein